MPKISIIIPVYNKWPYLQKTLQSVIMQDLKDVEVIIVDDSIDDESINCCKEVCSKFNNFTYVRGRACGVSAARNDGMDLAKGEYIFFLDADDTLIPNAIRLLLKRIDQLEGTDVIYFNYNHMHPKKSNPIIPYVYSDVWPNLPKVTRPGDDWIWCVVWNKLWRTEYLKESGVRFNEELIRCEDDHFCFEALMASKTIVYTTDFILNYNDMIEDSLFRTLNKEDSIKTNRAWRETWNKLLKSGNLTMEIGWIIISKLRR